jgi:hypothetical protein
MCCQHWRPRDANIFHVIPIAVGRGQSYLVGISVFLGRIFFGGRGGRK